MGKDRGERPGGKDLAPASSVYWVNKLVCKRHNKSSDNSSEAEHFGLDRRIFAIFFQSPKKGLKSKFLQTFTESTAY